MVIELNGSPTEPVWPAGIKVRSLKIGLDERAVVSAVRESFQDHWGYIERPYEEEFNRWQHRMDNDPDFDPVLWFLAMDGDEIAGISLCWPKVSDDPDMGWVQTLGVRRPWRKQGLGLALLQHSFGELYRRGKRKVGLGVDAQNLTGALRLYEKAGMRSDPAHQFSVYEKELRPGEDLATNQLEI
jgi:ribosomal protein S18 acetylase RimI-like enzyme